MGLKESAFEELHTALTNQPLEHSILFKMMYQTLLERQVLTSLRHTIFYVQREERRVGGEGMIRHQRLS